MKARHNHASPCTRKKMHCSTGGCLSATHKNRASPVVKRLSPDAERRHIHSKKEPGLAAELVVSVRDLFASNSINNVAMNIKWNPEIKPFWKQELSMKRAFSVSMTSGLQAPMSR